MIKLSDALYGDYRKEEVKEFIQAQLKKIPVLSNFDEDEDVPLEILEKMLWKIGQKYGILMQYIMPSLQDRGTPYYSVSFKTRDDHKWVGSINGVSIYEVFAKGVLMCYSISRKLDKNIH